MSEQSTPGASMPGFENQTVILTEPAKPAPVQHVSETAGMSPSQAASQKFRDDNRAAIVKGDNWLLKREYDKHMRHVFQGGPDPNAASSRAASREAAAKNDMRPLSETDGDVQFGAALDPITESDIKTIAQRGVTAGQLPHDLAEATATFCLASELPKAVSNVVMDRVARHHQGGYGPGEAMSEAEIADFRTALVERFGSEEKAEQEVNLARKYLHSVGGDKLLEIVDKRAGSLGFDAYLITQLSHAARARGLK